MDDKNISEFLISCYGGSSYLAITVDLTLAQAFRSTIIKEKLFRAQSLYAEEYILLNHFIIQIC
jgi:hypothetical protein